MAKMVNLKNCCEFPVILMVSTRILFNAATKLVDSLLVSFPPIPLSARASWTQIWPVEICIDAPFRSKG